MIEPLPRAFSPQSAPPRGTSAFPGQTTKTASVPSPRGIAGALGQWWRTRTQPARHLRLVETLALGPKRSVALLELDGQRFLAGMGADGVTTLVPVPAGAPAGEGNCA